MEKLISGSVFKRNIFIKVVTLIIPYFFNTMRDKVCQPTDSKSEYRGEGSFSKYAGQHDNSTFVMIFVDPNFLYKSVEMGTDSALWFTYHCRK